MSIQELPVRSDFKAYTFQVDLEGITYGFVFRFNTRINLWVMDIQDAGGDDILTGILVQTNVPMTDQFLHLTALPPGRFIPIDESGNNLDAGIDDLGNNIKIVYEESA